jgi:hypothetical protein
MKTITTPVMRRFGFRSVLVWNGTLAAASIAAFAFVPAGAPRPLLLALLFFAGATRSMQFTALNTLTFADIAPHQRSAATTLSSMLQQVALVLAFTVSVGEVRAVQFFRGADPAAPEALALDFRLALAGVALVGLISALRFLTLHPATGSEVSGHRYARPSASGS